jgi:hypothetical protein
LEAALVAVAALKLAVVLVAQEALLAQQVRAVVVLGLQVVAVVGAHLVALGITAVVEMALS